MSLGETDRAAREALRARQGKGARYDAPNAPAEDLLLARRGTAWFARKLMELSDVELYEPSARDGFTRAHVVSAVSYSARRSALMLESLRMGVEYAPASDEEEQLPTLDLAATLPARALRHLFSHSEVHLNVCLRDLADAHWDMPFPMAIGNAKTPRALVRLRAMEVWFGSVDLANGARSADIPAILRSEWAPSVDNGRFAGA